MPKYCPAFPVTAWRVVWCRDHCCDGDAEHWWWTSWPNERSRGDHGSQNCVYQLGMRTEIIRLVFAFSSARNKNGWGGLRIAHWVLEMRSVSSPCLTVKGSSSVRIVRVQSNHLLKMLAMLSTLTSTPCSRTKQCTTVLHLPHYGTGNEQVVPTKKFPPHFGFCFAQSWNRKPTWWLESAYQADKHNFPIRDHRVNVRWVKQSTSNVLHRQRNRGPYIRQLFMPLQKVPIRTLPFHGMSRQRLYPDDFGQITIFAWPPPGISWNI